MRLLLRFAPLPPNNGGFRDRQNGTGSVSPARLNDITSEPPVIWGQGGRLFLLTLCALAVATAAIAAPKITVRSEASVSDRAIRLRDIAPSATGPLGNVTLGAAALPGRSCKITAGEIRLRVRAEGQNPDVLVLPPAVTVTTTSVGTVKGMGNALVTAATEAVRKALPWPAGDVTLEPAFVPSLPIFRSSGTPIITAGAPVLRSSRTAVVPVSVALGMEARTVEVTLRIKVTALAVVAVRPIPRHALVSSEDVTLARVEVSGTGALANVADVVGKRAVSSLPAGRRLSQSDVEEAPVLLANARVTVRVVAGMVEITTAGTACEEGRLGQMIRVRLLPDPAKPGPTRILRGRVESSDTVIVGE